MDLRAPDRVPLMCQLSIGHMLQQLKVSPVEFWFDKDIFVDGLTALRNLYHFDGILISLHGHDPDWRKQIVKVAKDENGESVYWKNGDVTYFPDDELPEHHPAKQILKPSFQDFEPDSLPEGISFIPVSQGIEFAIHPEHAYDVFVDIADKARRYSIHGEITSPFDYFLNLFGHQEALLGLIDDPEKCHRILQRYTDGIKKLATGMCEHGVDAIKISSPFSGSGFISRKFYREFVLPYERQLAEEIRARGVHVYAHVCGAIDDRLEDIVDSGVSGIECLDPPPLGNVELADAKRRIGRRAFIKGNIDSVNILLYGSRDDVFRDAMQRLEEGMPGGGYILSTACSVAPHVPRDNMLVLHEVVEKYGWYRNE
ncbi:MAG: uroporphyrinogen decarboxylase family protein [Bacteroidota bacterium]